MKCLSNNKINRLLIAILSMSILLNGALVLAADDPSIKGDLRQAITESMTS